MSLCAAGRGEDGVKGLSMLEPCRRAFAGRVGDVAPGFVLGMSVALASEIALWCSGHVAAPSQQRLSRGVF